MNKKEKTKKIKEELSQLRPFRSGCYVCGCKQHRKGMTFHHLWYITNDAVYSEYKKLDKSSEYYNDLKPLIISNPKRFLYVCSPHHQSIERLKRFSKEKFAKLIKAVRMSK